jgi:uridine phosphorylase
MKEQFSPQMYVEYFIKKRGISVKDIGVAPVVVLSWGTKVIQHFANVVHAKRSPNWFYDEDHIVYQLYTGNVNGQQVSFVLSPEGAPATVMMMEELIACGARIFWGLGWAGSLQQLAPIGTIIIPINCVSEEGTSSHYILKRTELRPDRGLVNILKSAAYAEGVNAITGSQWTTDAPYRELANKVKLYRRQGILGVDMETSAMYALGKFRKIKVCNLLVVSDEMWGNWRPAFRETELKQSMQLAQRIILRCVGYDYNI